MNNRKIKFRVWDSDQQIMDYPEDTPKYVLTGLGELRRYNDIVDNKHYIIQQLTGMVDRNGKKIYEGDIVEYIEGVELGDKSKYVCVVKYDEEIMCFGYAKNPNGDCLNYPWEGIVSAPTVIGNVFENEELLNETNN